MYALEITIYKGAIVILSFLDVRFCEINFCILFAIEIIVIHLIYHFKTQI